MTSLAAQLKKLSVPDAQITLSGDFKQASFLYNEREAAKYDKQHFYNIGINGLQQLIVRDKRFAEFENTIFSPSARSLQRTVQTDESNKLLDDIIVKFLLTLSPYMQLRESHKALEWLVNRFNIHLRNVDAFMMCVLPYHDQEPFIMALRLLKMNTSQCAKWRWLEAVKKGDSFLPRSVLISHCRTSRGFLGFLCETLSQHIEANTDNEGIPSRKHLSRVISFYTQTVLGVLMASSPTEENISTLIPFLSKGLKATDLPDLILSSYMIISQLLVSTSLAEPLLESILNVICKNVLQPLLNTALQLLILMFQRQNISKFSKKALRHIILHHTLSDELFKISQVAKLEHFLVPFLSALMQKVLKGSGSDFTSDSGAENGITPRSPFAILMDIMENVEFGKKTVAAITRHLLEWLVANPVSEMTMDTDVLNRVQQDVFKIYQCLENRYNSLLESALTKWCGSDESREKIVEKVQLMNVELAHQDLISDPVSSVTVCLLHHQKTVRKSAVEKILEDPNLIQDKQDLQGALSMRLQDEDNEVVDAILKNPQNLWKLFDDKLLLYNSLMDKLAALGNSSTRSDTKDHLIRTICCAPSDKQLNDSERTIVVLSFLVAMDKHDVDLAQDLLLSPFSISNEILNHLNKTFLPEIVGKIGKINMAGLMSDLIKNLAQFLSQKDALEQLNSWYKCLARTPHTGSAALIILMVHMALIELVADEALVMSLQRQLASMIINIMLKKKPELMNNQCLKRDGTSFVNVLSTCISSLKDDGCLPLSLVLYCLQNMRLGNVPKVFLESPFWGFSKVSETDANWLSCITSVFTLLLDLSTHQNAGRRDLAKTVFQVFIKALSQQGLMLKLFCMLWTWPQNQGLTNVTRGQCLQFGQAFLSSLSDGEKTALVTNEEMTVVSSLVVLLTSDSEQARRVAFNIMSSLSVSGADDSTPFQWFSNKLLQHRQEVENDQAFLAQVLKNSLEDESDVLPPSPKKRRKSSKMFSSASAMNFILDIICSQQTPNIIKLGLLTSLSRLDSAESFLPLMKFMKEIVSTHAPVLTTLEIKMLKLLLHRFTPTVAPSIDEKSVSFESLQAALRCEAAIANTGNSVQFLAVKKIHKKFLAALPSDSRLAILAQLLEIITSSKNVRVTERCRRLLKQMKLELKLLNDHVAEVLGSAKAGTVRDAKRQKVGSAVPAEDSEFISLPWKRVTVLLELVLNKKNVEHLVSFVPIAFQLLARVLEIESPGSGEFMKQLVLGAINNICSECMDTEGEEQVKGDNLNVQHIVHCIRTSDSPQTHHQALLLLSVAAKIAPDMLLHNMMTVFTFMGASILRQDNEYSFQVIARLLENVVPALITACEEKAKQTKPSPSTHSDNVITVVLRVFVDALPHMPSHRKVSLFSKLLSVVGVENCLWRLVLLFMASIVSRPKSEPEDEVLIEEEKTSGPIPSADLEFIVGLSEEFSSIELFDCMSKIVKYLSELPETSPDLVQKDRTEPTSLDCMSKEELEIFSVHCHTSKQLRHFKFAAVYVLTQLLASQHLIAQLCDTETSVFLTHFRKLMETVLHYINQVTAVNEKHKEDSSTKFWRLFLHKCHDLLDNLVKFLPDTTFMEVMFNLMNNPLKSVQKRSIDILNAKLQQCKENDVTKNQISMLLKMVNKLQLVVTENLLSARKSSPNEDEIINGQTAIYSLKILCRILGEKHHQQFLEVLKLCVKALSRHSENSMICASAMLCIADVVNNAKAHAVGHLGDFMPNIIQQIQSDSILKHEVLLLSAIMSLQKIIEAVPLFLSPYLVDIMVQVSVIKSMVQVNSGSHKPTVIQKVMSICTTISSVTATRTFLPSIEKCFAALHDKNVMSIDCALSMLKEHIMKMSREDLSVYSQDLLKFFCTCFELRMTMPEANESDLNDAEGSVIEAFVSLVFKLSEAQFKPMLLQLYGWATNENAGKERILVFYRLCDSLAKELKNLFTLFAGHILKHAAETLDANNRSKGKVKFFGKGKAERAKSSLLLQYILGCLHKTFTHDTEGFMNQERFDIVMQPLIDQIENEVGKPSEAAKRVEDFLVPCLSKLAVAAHDDNMWKTMNYQILLKTRSESEKVRLWALSAINALHTQLGEDYIQLVPETIPFMAELMEDESDEVEKFTQKVIAEMEISVGENLQEYF